MKGYCKVFSVNNTSRLFVSFFKKRVFFSWFIMQSFGNRNTSINSYLNEVKSFISYKNGNALSSSISLQRSVTLYQLNAVIENTNNWEDSVSKVLDNPWDEVVKYNMLSYKSLIQSKRNYSTAFDHKCTVIQALIQVATNIKEENWMLPVIYINAIELRKLAICADSSVDISDPKRSVKADTHLEEAALQLMGCFRICAVDMRTSIESSKRKGMINIINQLFKIYFKINKLNLYKPLVKAIDNADIMEHFSQPQRVTYSYFTGMKTLYDSDYKKADNLLTFAFENCLKKYHKNRRIILIFLIPVRILNSGCMPSEKLLMEYDLMQFKPLCDAIKEGNLFSFDEAIENHSNFFFFYGIYFTLEKLKIIVYRNIFKKVAKYVDTHQIDVDHIVNAINYYKSNRGQRHLTEDEIITCPEVYCLLANLICENKLKGYISLQHQKLVISKKDPFPNLSTV